jgi:thymidylate synthase (FAD)
MLDVVLIDYARDPLTKLYGAYRTCYTQKTPREVWAEIESEPGRALQLDPTVTEERRKKPEEISNFVKERLKTGHVSPLEQVVFWFGISGVSRALSHQLVRHRIGISFEQQSQRYVRYKGDQLDFVKPKSWEKFPILNERYEALMRDIGSLYSIAVKSGIPNEDARFILPNAMPTNFQVMVNFAELLHIADLRLCWRAQWEIRRMVALMRAEVKKAVPELAAFIQPKCGENRSGSCDESLKDYHACPLSKVRPHKQELLDLWKDARALTEEQMSPPETP